MNEENPYNQVVLYQVLNHHVVKTYGKIVPPTKGSSTTIFYSNHTLLQLPCSPCPYFVYQLSLWMPLIDDDDDLAMQILLATLRKQQIQNRDTAIEISKNIKGIKQSRARGLAGKTTPIMKD